VTGHLYEASNINKTKSISWGGYIQLAQESKDMYTTDKKYDLLTMINSHKIAPVSFLFSDQNTASSHPLQDS
jgi:hypothetical protein